MKLNVIKSFAIACAMVTAGYGETASNLLLGKQPTFEKEKISKWESALDYARALHDEQLAEALLRKEANMILDDITHTSLLEYVCFSGYYPLLPFLLQQGGDECFTNSMGTSLLMFACCTHWNQSGRIGDNRKIIDFLLKRGHDVNEKSINGMTPFLTACLYGDIETVKLLRSRGAQPNANVDDGCNGFYLAVLNDDLDIISFLLQEIPDKINERTNQGETALDLATTRGSRAIIQLLMSHGAVKGNRKEAIPLPCKEPKPDSFFYM